MSGDQAADPRTIRVQATDAGHARRRALDLLHGRGLYGIRVLDVTRVDQSDRWDVVAKSARRLPDRDPIRPVSPAGYWGGLAPGMRIRTRADAQGTIGGRRASMPAGEAGVVGAKQGLYLRVRLDRRPEGTFVMRPEDLELLP